jgi:hypothetical protein
MLHQLYKEIQPIFKIELLWVLKISNGLWRSGQLSGLDIAASDDLEYQVYDQFSFAFEQQCTPTLDNFAASYDVEIDLHSPD